MLLKWHCGQAILSLVEVKSLTLNTCIILSLSNLKGQTVRNFFDRPSSKFLIFFRINQFGKIQGLKASCTNLQGTWFFYICNVATQCHHKKLCTLGLSLVTSRFLNNELYVCIIILIMSLIL